ncbi:Transcriptional regulatory protein DEP1 [Escovopsis weberi]|uniref:Transcriptional regulatory protein DEP1 n=1 Tax=Escovopsis weberi TaxID=150374 RepID=A0A0M9VTD5_ESCWE|nr:Transcriptional regulatory protein DEP1 [Escovopsis weberi]
MAATAAASAALPPGGPVSGDLEDGNVSSPLSEVDDKDANDEEMERMHLDDNDGDNSSFSGEENQPAHNDGSDSESALSEAASDVNSEANDTEAETLRLYDTPRNHRHRDVLVDQFNDDQVFEHTPENPRRTQAAAAAAADADADADDESVSGDEGSVVSSRAGAHDSPTKHAAEAGASLDEDAAAAAAAAAGSPQDRKRKRSPVIEPLGPEAPPTRKRSSSELDRKEGAGDGADVAAAATAATAATEDEKRSPLPQRGSQSPGGDRDPRPTLENAPEDTLTAEPDSRAAKKAMRGGSKRRNALTDSADDDTPLEAEEESPDAAAEGPREPQDEDMEVDLEEEAAHRNAEEMERKQAAYRDWTHIEEMFGIFRERLYKDRLQRLEEEEQSLLAAEPTHPEYLNMKQCLDDRLNQKLEAANKEYEFRMKAHERRAVAQRSQVWSQYFQAVRERREQTLEALNKQWYDVQSARRNAHSLPDYGLLFPRDPAQRVRNAIAYNTEVSTLAGMAKYEGFPAGPELKGASAPELEADLAQMEFLKDTPWANPNHSAHKLYQHPSIQGEAPHEPVATTSRIAHRNLSSAPDLKATLDVPTPPTQQRSASLAARLPESPEMARSIAHPSPAHQMKRMGSIPSLSRGSKAAAA